MVDYNIINLIVEKNSAKTIEMANLTAGDLQTPEYQTIVDLSDTVRIGIQSDLGRIVTRMYSVGIITPDERDDVLDSQTNQASNQLSISL